MWPFVDMPAIQTNDKSLESTLRGLVRKLRESFIRANGAFGLKNVSSMDILYGMGVRAGGNGEALPSARRRTCLGVSVTRAPAPSGTLVDIKSVGEAECLFPQGQNVFPAHPFWIHPDVPGLFTIEPCSDPPCGIVLDTRIYTATNRCRCLLSMPYHGPEIGTVEPLH